ncbi:hypothetical protein IQ269_24405 [Tychonema sp. LEGE 07199]|uniref:hypothetical protein n=1 Tax=unclassified Tychonema TaxID=2642144 RepID=UPI00187F9A40|nr:MULTISPECIES: hypothetical protein [unclassified Tychonema]MBE9123854.1 hypothetical protein [Tychonema sp. LEGE 07199]MBE9131936.1 hypothetical protein [Tychonema sp. LEGE 07196]
MEETAVPFPYPTIIVNGGHGNAVSLPHNYRQWRTRQCRFPTPQLSSMEDTAVPFPYPTMIDRPIECNYHPICRDTALPSPDFG